MNQFFAKLKLKVQEADTERLLKNTGKAAAGAAGAALLAGDTNFKHIGFVSAAAGAAAFFNFIADPKTPSGGKDANQS